VEEDVELIFIAVLGYRYEHVTGSRPWENHYEKIKICGYCPQLLMVLPTQKYAHDASNVENLLRSAVFSFSFGGIALEYTERTSPEEAKLNDHKLHKQPIL